MEFNTSYRTNKFSPGLNTKRYLMIHHTGDKKTTSDINAVKYLALSTAQVSCHYIVGRNGDRYQTYSDDGILWHAGKGKRGNIVNTMNYHAIGIEIVSDGYEFSEEQKKSTKQLIQYLMKKYNIPKENVIRHAMYSTIGKRDVGPGFYSKSWTDYQNELVNIDLTEVKAALAANSALRHATPYQDIKDLLEKTNQTIRKKHGL